MVIIVIKDIDLSEPWFLRAPFQSGVLLLIAAGSIFVTILAVKEISGGLPVVVTKATNKSGDMFGYTIPYMLSFMRIEPDWQTLVILVIFFGMLFSMAYRTQAVLINPILAMAGYMLVDCAFKRGEKEIQAMVITRIPINIGDSCRLERLSHYLFIAAQPNSERPRRYDEH